MSIYLVKLIINQINGDSYVKKYKNHNAILLWELGNEYNYHPEWFNGNIDNWYNSMNSAAYEIKKIQNVRL